MDEQNIDYVKVIKKMDYKLFVLKEQNKNDCFNMTKNEEKSHNKYKINQ